MVLAASLFLLLLLLLLPWVAKTAECLWFKPRRLERALRAQGLKGTPYRFLFGDLKDYSLLSKEAKAKPMPLCHDIVPRVLPFLHRSINQYGKFSFHWFGSTPRVTILDPEIIGEVLAKFVHFEKAHNPFGRLLVTGVLAYEGEQWTKHRRILNPAFRVEKLKEMFPAFSTCCCELIDRWENMVSPEGRCELDVFAQFQNFTGDVISRAAFGSSYEEGKHIFQLQAEQALCFVQAAQTAHIPGYRFLPTANNMRMKKIHRVLRATIRGIIDKREKAMKEDTTNPCDLLGLLMESNMNSESPDHWMTTDEVVEECKLFYFAGHESTSVLLTWVMVALSMHPSWQVRAREEVLEVFGKNKPDKDGLSRLKVVTMILNEVLRLYPPAALLTRRNNKTIQLEGITLPEGVSLLLPLIVLHHDPEFWGEDANEFKPERFAKGVSKASKNQAAYFPFSAGPRICIGQNFAMLEAKLALSSILQRFSFELSSSYAHAPHTVLTLHPQHGAQLILHKL